MAMCRLNYVKSNRKEYRCRRCGQPITVGSGYVWFQFRYGGPQCFHNNEKCMPKPYERESNEKMRVLEEGRYNAEQSLSQANDTSEMAEALRSFMGSVEEVRDMYQESMDNMPEQFQGSSDVWCEMEGKVDELQSWYDDLESAADELESAEEPDADELTKDGDDQDSALEEWLEERRSEAYDAINAY